MKAFDIDANGKTLDYRVGENLNLEKVKQFFEKKYDVIELIQEKRHVVGTLKKDNSIYFLKLSTTQGISEKTKPEYAWNKEFNKLVLREKSDFWVPINFESGFYNENLFYIITDKFNGNLFTNTPEKTPDLNNLKIKINNIIEFSEKIQSLDIKTLSEKENADANEHFLEKTIAWFEEIPNEVIEKYNVLKLLEIVKHGYLSLNKRPRHGDFTPWHMFDLKNNKIGLIDAEHAMANGIEYYDISYFIQRVFSVLEEEEFARKILTKLIERNYNENKLRVVLSARAIGGFLDESLKPKPNYLIHERFKKWVMDLI